MIENLFENFSRKIIAFGDSGLKILLRDLFESKKYKRYPGNAVKICKSIIKDRWNGVFFEAGSTIFRNQFWVRDFGLSLKGIIN